MASVTTANAVRNYVARHWRGDLPLALSYFVNGCLSSLLSISAALAACLLVKPVNGSLITALSISLFWLFISALATWQLVGIWRSAGKHRRRGGSAFWTRAARVMVAFGALSSLGTVANSGIPQVTEFWRVAAGNRMTSSPHNQSACESCAGGTAAGISGRSLTSGQRLRS
jgi:hypothetical protein